LLGAQLATSSAFAGGATGLLSVDGTKLLDSGRAADRCAALEERHRREPALGVRMELAECHEQSGRTASAWGGYLSVATQARSRGEDAIEKAAGARAAAIEPRLVRLEVDVDAASTNGLALKRNGATLQHVEWDVSVPIDPGTYTIEASAPGRSPWSSSIVITTERARWSVHVPELHVAQPMRNGLQIARPIPRKPGGGFPVASILTMGAGALAIGAGAYLGIRSLDQADEAAAHCRGTACDPRGSSLRSDASESRAIATGAIVVGGGLVAVGALIWLLAPSRKSLLPPPPRVGQVRLLPGLGRIDLKGTF
jgi:hypothetical protein